ncbi:histidine-rich glycoprotein-like isoform X2 [Colias croceus]|uniref:histidine-rich glycoprotein-like isoform X2 n=1 Tax=Colias crocea TaxID=72248 RepID=UPI001E27CF6F|nr:histidine-rich glycoprotein-like isoform X2 [Colias croceus]
MEEGGYWRPSCSTLSLAEHHGSSTHLCARHAPRMPHRHLPHGPHAHHAHHAHAHAHHLQHAQPLSCPVHSPFRQPTPEYCAAHAQTEITASVIRNS